MPRVIEVAAGSWGPQNPLGLSDPGMQGPNDVQEAIWA